MIELQDGEIIKADSIIRISPVFLLSSYEEGEEKFSWGFDIITSELLGEDSNNSHRVSFLDKENASFVRRKLAKEMGHYIYMLISDCDVIF